MQNRMHETRRFCNCSTFLTRQACFSGAASEQAELGEFVMGRLPALPASASDVDAQRACALDDKCSASVGQKMYGSCWKWNKPDIAQAFPQELEGDDNGYKQFDTNDAKTY